MVVGDEDTDLPALAAVLAGEAELLSARLKVGGQRFAALRVDAEETLERVALLAADTDALARRPVATVLVGKAHVLALTASGRPEYATRAVQVGGVLDREIRIGYGEEAYAAMSAQTLDGFRIAALHLLPERRAPQHEQLVRRVELVLAGALRIIRFVGPGLAQVPADAWADATRVLRRDLTTFAEVAGPRTGPLQSLIPLGEALPWAVLTRDPGLADVADLFARRCGYEGAAVHRGIAELAGVPADAAVEVVLRRITRHLPAAVGDLLTPASAASAAQALEERLFAALAQAFPAAPAAPAADRAGPSGPQPAAGAAPAPGPPAVPGFPDAGGPARTSRPPGPPPAAPPRER